MFQAFSAWSESYNQKCLYVGILIGPFLTVLVFNHPPNHPPNNQLPSAVLSPGAHPQDDVENEMKDEELFCVEERHLCDAFPQDHAPQLVIYTKHILEEPGDWKAGLSAPLQCIFHLATMNIVRGFEPSIVQEPSNIFHFEGNPQTPYDVAAEEQVNLTALLDVWILIHWLYRELTMT